jgi:hypothetical protein
MASNSSEQNNNLGVWTFWFFLSKSVKIGLKPEHSNGRYWMQRVTVQFMPKSIRNRNKLTVQWFDDIEVLNNFLCKNYMSSLIFVVCYYSCWSVGHGNTVVGTRQPEKSRIVLGQKSELFWYPNIVWREREDADFKKYIGLEGQNLLGNAKWTPEGSREFEKTIGSGKARKSGFLALYTYSSTCTYWEPRDSSINTPSGSVL